MAYSVKYHAEHKHAQKGNVTTYRVELLKKAYGGGTTRLIGAENLFTHEYEEIDPRKILDTPVQKASLTFNFMVSDSSDFSVLEEVFGADEDEYLLRYKKNGAPQWTGKVLPDLMEWPESGYPFEGTIVAKDLSSLKGKTYPLVSGTSKLKLPDFLQDNILNELGFDLDLITYTNWTHNSLDDTDDYLNQIHKDQYHLRDYPDTAITKYEALKELLRGEGLLLRQANNQWELIQVPYFANDTTYDRYTYDTTGTQTNSETGVDIDINIDRNERFVLPTSNNKNYAGVKRVTQQFNHKTDISTLPFEPSYLHDSSQDTSTVSTEFDSDGSQRVIISGTALMDIAETGGTANGVAKFYIKAGSYYWNPDTGNWDNTAPIPYIEVDLFGLADELLEGQINLTTAPIPSPASGNIEVQFEWGTASREDGTSLTVQEVEWQGWSATIVDGSQAASSASITYQMEQTGNWSYEIELDSKIFGTGPTRYSKSPIWGGANGGTYLDDKFGLVGGTYDKSAEELFLSEFINTQQSARRWLRADLMGDYGPESIIGYDSKRFFFLGGSLTAKRSTWDASILELSYGAASTTISEVFDEAGATGGASGSYDASRAGITIVQQRLNYENQRITTTTGDLSGTVTSIPIESAGVEFLTVGDTFYVFDIIDGSITSFVLAEPQLANDTSLSVESKAVSGTIPSRSWILFTGQKISSYLTRTDNAIRMGVNDYEQLTDGNGEAITDPEDGEEIADPTFHQGSQFALLKNQVVVGVREDGRLASFRMDASKESGSEIAIIADQVDINNWSFIKESGYLVTDNYVEGSSGILLDGPSGHAELNSMEIRNGVVEKSDIKDLVVKGKIANSADDYLIDETGFTVYTQEPWDTNKSYAVVEETSGTVIGGVRGNSSAVFLEGRDDNDAVILARKVNLSGVIRCAHTTRTISSGTLNIDSGAPMRSFVTVFNEGGASSDEIDTIEVNGDGTPEAGTIIYLEANENAGKQTTLNDGTGNISTGVGNVILGNGSDSQIAALMYSSNSGLWKLINQSI